jgi:hypothetical protein
MRNTVEHTGKAFLGLTFNCAHCHDHKYDPITQVDYFRLRAFFEPIYVRQDRVPGEADPGPFQDYNYSTLRKIQRLGAVRIFDRTPDAPTWFYTGGDERNRVKERGSIPPGVPAFLAEGLPKIEKVELPPRAWYPGLRPAIHETILADAHQAVKKAEAELAAARSAKSGLPLAEAKHAAAHADLASIEARIAADRARHGETPGADENALVREASRLERQAHLRRAEANLLTQEHALAEAEKGKDAKKIETAKKAVPSAKADLDKAKAAAGDLAGTYTPFSPVYPRTSTGRRRALAEWITSRDNPLTARVAVNQIWMRHFNAPLVASVHDFGLNGARPTHPELLDWLAVELIESGWSMKHLHRLIVTSAAYRRASSVGDAEANVEVDPENKLLWRMNPGRMEAEVVRDSLLFCANRLDARMGGQELENGESLTTQRRSLYYSVFPEQGGKSPLGELFDGPDALECYRRSRSVIPQQALALTNSELVHQVSAVLAATLWDEMEMDPKSDTTTGNKMFILAAFERILSRPPTSKEVELCSSFLAGRQSGGEVRARESLVRALFNHNDFITIR